MDPLVKVSLTPKTVFSVYVVMDERREPMEVKGSQTVRELKKTLESMAGLPSSKFNLYHHDKQSHYGPDRLRFMDKLLYTYHLTDGDELIIVPK